MPPKPKTGECDRLIWLMKPVQAKPFSIDLGFEDEDADIAKLEVELLKYGGHSGSCDQHMDLASGRLNCTCGWRDRRRELHGALADAKEPTT